MKKPRTEEDDVERQEVRVLIDNYEASVIIGKGGSNVKQIRADSNAFVSILKNELSGSKERIMQVTGTVEFNAAALRMIAELLLKSDAERNGSSEGYEPKETCVMKILVHQHSVGALIGKGGVIIKAMQTETGCKVSISTDSLGNSTEKTVTVTGKPAELHDVITRILTRISEHPLRPGTTSILHVPGQVMAFPVGNPYSAPGPYGMHSYSMPPAGPYGAPMGGGAGQKTQKIVIPTVCAGTVIGKRGSIIGDIKNQSGTSISVAAAEPSNPDDRVVSITGSEQGIQTAIYLIRQRVESYQPPPVSGSNY